MKIRTLDETRTLSRIAEKIRSAPKKKSYQFGGVEDLLRKEIQDRNPNQIWVESGPQGETIIMDTNNRVVVDPMIALSAIQQLGYSPSYEELWETVNTAGTASSEESAPQVVAPQVSSPGVAARRRRNGVDDSYQEVFREMMNAWDTLLGDIRAEYPNLSEEEIYQIASEVMRSSLNL